MTRVMAQAVDILVVKDRKQLRPQIAPRLEHMNFPQSARDTILDKIFRRDNVSRQRPGVTHQPRDQGFDLISKPLVAC
jgi:hypothetical protein